MSNGINNYQTVDINSKLQSASPHTVIQMLLDGAIDRINIAKGHMQRKNIQEKAKYINKALDIVGGLRCSLDFEKGGEIALNLDQLYDFMERHLITANTKNNLQNLEEVKALLEKIKEGWEGIPQEVRDEHSEQ